MQTQPRLFTKNAEFIKYHQDQIEAVKDSGKHIVQSVKLWMSGERWLISMLHTTRGTVFLSSAVSKDGFMSTNMYPIGFMD